MQVKIVEEVGKDKSNKKDKNKYIFLQQFVNKKIKNVREINVKKNDIIFLDKDNNVKSYHTYNDLIKYYNNIPNNANKALLINKFSYFFSLHDEYSMNKCEIEILSKITKDYKLLFEKLELIYDRIELEGVINDKLIVGLGNHSVHETSITLHGTYGIPYIPSSAIKGVLRNYLIKEYYNVIFTDNNGNHKDDSCESQLLTTIFGGKNKDGKNVKGKVIFMDIFPTSFCIKKDIITPHHSNYYRENENDVLPLDTDEPKPIEFLILQNNDDKECKFNFNLLVDKSISRLKIGDIEENEKLNVYKDYYLYDFIEKNIKDAIELNGLGAKTSVGYGYFNIK
ncbi:type III-B CRISPR module RAMP protein Cmr6 [Vallitalea sediminicola]